VPGMGMILWGASPLYIFREEVIMTTSKSTSRRQGQRGDPMSERSPSANLRADEQKSHRRPNPWAREHNIPKPVRRTWGLVNAAVVQREIMSLPGESCLPKRRNGRGGTEPARVRVNRAAVSRGREPGGDSGERSEGSVMGHARELK